MKKQKIFVIASSILLLSILNGCTEEKKNIDQEITDIITLKELSENLSKYIGKKLNVTGHIRKVQGDEFDMPYFTSLCNTNETNPSYCIMLYVPTNITIYSGFYEIYGYVDVFESDDDLSIMLPRVDIISATPL